MMQNPLRSNNVLSNSSAPGPSITIRNILEDIILVERLFSEDRLFEAFILLRNIESLIEKVTDDPGKDKVLYVLSNSKIIPLVRVSGKQILSLLESLKDSDEWNTWKDGMGPNQDIKLSLHRDETPGQYFFRIEGFLRNCSMMQVIAAWLEISLHSYWMPLCSSTAVLDVLSPYRRIVRNEIDLVFLKKICVSNIHSEFLPGGGVLTTIQPVVELDDDLKYLPKQKEARMNMWGGILMEYMDMEVETKKSELSDLVVMMSKESVHYNKYLQSTTKSRINDFDETASNGSDNMYSIYEDKEEQKHSINENKDSSMAASSSMSTPKKVGGFGRRPSMFLSPSMKDTKAHDPNDLLIQEDLRLANSYVSGIKIQAIFKADLNLNYVPDWIFNLGLRSSVSMLFPMLERQASFFSEGGLNYDMILKNKAFYDEIGLKLQQAKDQQLDDAD